MSAPIGPTVEFVLRRRSFQGVNGAMARSRLNTEYNVRSLNEKKNGGTEQTGYCSSRFCVLIFFFVFQNFGLDCFNN